MNKINTMEELNQAVKDHEVFFLLKHSTTCPISQAAYGEYENFTKENNEVPAYYLTVQEARPLSNHIAETYEIKHESPQALLFSHNNVLWNASHWGITKKSLIEAIEENKEV